MKPLFEKSFQPDYFNRNLFEKLESTLKDIKVKSSIQTEEENNLWSNLPGAYGAYLGDVNQLKTPQLIYKWENIDPVLDDINLPLREEDVLFAIENVLNQILVNNNRYTIYNLNKENEVLKLYDINSGTYIDNVVKSISYIFDSLTSGIPVIMGVNCQQHGIVNNMDESTNHHIMIVGMGNDGRNYLHGWDIIALLNNPNMPEEYKNALSVTNKIYFDNNWPGLLKAEKPWINSYAKARQEYKITHLLKTFIYKD